MVGTTKLLALNIDPALRKDFKKVTADNDETMTTVVVDCIKKYLADKKKVIIC